MKTQVLHCHPFIYCNVFPSFTISEIFLIDNKQTNNQLMCLFLGLYTIFTISPFLWRINTKCHLMTSLLWRNTQQYVNNYYYLINKNGQIMYVHYYNDVYCIFNATIMTELVQCRWPPIFFCIQRLISCNILILITSYKNEFH